METDSNQQKSDRESEMTSIEILQEQRKRKAIGLSLLRAVWIIALTLLSCELIARFIVFVGKPASSENAQHDIKYLVARTLSVDEDNVVLLGDSLMKQGLYPEEITAKLQIINPLIRVTNLAISGGSQNDAVSYLEYLRQNKKIKPKLAVYDFEVMLTGYKTAERDFDFHRDKSYLFNSVLRKPENLLETIAELPSRFSYLIRQRGSLKHFALDFFSLLARPKVFQDKSFFSLKDVSDTDSSVSGMSPHHRVTANIDMGEQQRRINSNFDHSPKSGHFNYNPKPYSIISDYCQAHQIPLILVWLPHQSSVYQAFWYKAPYTEPWFKEQFANYSKQPFIYPVYLNTLPDVNFYYSDYHHLNTLGCVAASDRFAEALSGKLRMLIEHSSHSIPDEKK